jgi:hypothetical protein
VGMKKHSYIFFILMFLFTVLNICSVNALDELFLTGVVRSVDSKSGIVIVDVKSEGCHGVRSFRVDNVSDLDGLEGKKISFFINSSTCKGDEVYKMSLPGGKKR